MIVRGFYRDRTHATTQDPSTVTASFNGCTYTAPGVFLVRTLCDQFLDGSLDPTVVLVDATEPSCPDCTRKLKMNAARVAANAH